MAKFLAMNENDLITLMDLFKKASPPESITKEEWKDECKELFINLTKHHYLTQIERNGLYYILREYGLQTIMRKLKMCNPPDGMTEDEWINEYKNTLISIAEKRNLRNIVFYNM